MLLIGVFILYIRVVSDWLTKFLAFAVWRVFCAY